MPGCEAWVLSRVTSESCDLHACPHRSPISQPRGFPMTVWVPICGSFNHTRSRKQTPRQFIEAFGPRHSYWFFDGSWHAALEVS